ncbi:MAG TPA: Gfo/Idh/MocA family oxidoreductase [Gemmatimonadaceae bacterium]
MRELRFALIGCGDIGILRARALLESRNCRLLVAVDNDAARAATVAALSPGVVALTDWREAIRREDVDAVIVSTPPSLHEEMTISALEAGKHVLCEKPLARTPAECRNMVEASERAGRRLATGFNYRFYPSFARARELLDSGIIGDLDHIRSYGGYSATSHNQPWVHDAGTVGGGSLRDIGIHLIDLTRDFLGDVVAVQGAASGRVWKYPGCEDNGFALLTSSRGNIAMVHASWTEWRRYQFRIEIYGSRGCIRATCFPMMVQVVWAAETGGRTQSKTDWFPRVALGEKLKSYRWVVVESFVRELDAFAAWVGGAPSRVATGADGLRAVEIATAAAGTIPVVTTGGGGHVPAVEQRRPERLSVVALAFGGGLEQCLTALESQTSALGAEVIVPHDSTLADAGRLRDAFPGVRFVELPGTRPPAELRAAGAALATGDVIAFLEGHCRPAPDWCARVMASHASPHAAVGGPIEKGLPDEGGDDTALNWSVYLADYSRYMLPLPEGATHALSDCNVSYKRTALEATREHWVAEFHENVVNEALRRAGHTMWFDPRMTVFEQRQLSVGAALRDRFSFGRLFGSTRVPGVGLPKRLVMSAAAMVMPPLLVARVAGNLRRRGRHQGQLLRCLPSLAMISAAWMAGEAVGYLTGTAGRSLKPAAHRARPVTA